jgi:hypothetical protein
LELIRKTLVIRTLGVIERGSKKQRGAKTTLKTTERRNGLFAQEIPPIEQQSDGVWRVTCGPRASTRSVPGRWQTVLGARWTGDVKGLTLPEIVALVEADPTSTESTRDGVGYVHIWREPGYTIRVLFDEEGRSIGVVPSVRLPAPV